MHAHSLSHVLLFATPWSVACKALLFMEFSRQEHERVAISYSWGSSKPRTWALVSGVSCIGRQTVYHWATWEAHNVHANIVFPLLGYGVM